MEPNAEVQFQRLNSLAIMACEFSGLNPFHMRDGQMLYTCDEAQARAKAALALLGGVNREPIA